MTKHRYTQSKLANPTPTTPEVMGDSVNASRESTPLNGSASDDTESTPVECALAEAKALDGRALNQEPKVVEVDTNEILVALLDQFKRINSVLEKQSQAQIQQAATLMQLTDGIKAINDRLKKPSFM